MVESSQRKSCCQRAFHGSLSSNVAECEQEYAGAEIKEKTPRQDRVKGRKTLRR